MNQIFLLNFLYISYNRWLSEINVFQPHACLNFPRNFFCKHDPDRKIVIEVLFYANHFSFSQQLPFTYKASFSIEMLQAHWVLVLREEGFSQDHFGQKKAWPHLQFSAQKSTTKFPKTTFFFLMVQTSKTQIVNLLKTCATGKSILLNQWLSFSCSQIKRFHLNNTLWQLTRAYQLKYWSWLKCPSSL